MFNKKIVKEILNEEKFYIDKVIRENYEKIYKYCYYQLRNSYIAEDITQDVFLKFLTNIEKYVECGKIINYLYAVARNTIYDYLRQPKNMALQELEKESAEEEKRLGVIENRMIIFEALDQLEEIEREIIILKHYQELKLKDIAIVLKIPISTTRYKLKNAEKKLKVELLGGA